jgi:pantoate--beta-alanine ligase
MGALHAGHQSLVSRGRELAPSVALSVFVNPLQFGPREDLTAYPRDLEADAARAERWGVDLLFAPDAAELTPPDAAVRVDPGPLGSRLEGHARPGHFRGVLTIVAKLFHILTPDVAVFGRKDLQQVVLVRQMARDLDLDVRIEEVSTVRDADGLALSSRNAYLSPAERLEATALYRALRAGEQALAHGTHDARALESVMRAVLDDSPSIETDYAEVRRAEDLADVDHVSGSVALLVAARVGRTRLIDNVVVTPGARP